MIIQNQSSWEIHTDMVYPKLNEILDTDVVIVGAGITGILNAYMLAKVGIRVVVLEEDKHILQGVTLGTTAFIESAIDTSFTELITMFGAHTARLVHQAGQDALKLFAEIIQEEHIDCDYQSVSAYTYATTERQFRELGREYLALKKSGFDVHLQKNGRSLNFFNTGFMEMPGQAKFHPIKFGFALARCAESLGVQFFTSSEVVAVEGLTVRTHTGQVKARDIIFATHSPFTNEGTRFKKGKYISFVYELEIPRGTIPEGLYQDMHNPYHYFRIDNFDTFDRMIVGGEDNRKEIRVHNNKNFYALEKFVKKLLGNTHYRITRKWYGPILESADGLALIGSIKAHTYVATAFSGNGITYAAISALMIRDVILGHDNPYASIFDPLRIITFKRLFIKALDYAEEFFGGVFKNFFLPKQE